MCLPPPPPPPLAHNMISLPLWVAGVLLIRPNMTNNALVRIGDRNDDAIVSLRNLHTVVRLLLRLLHSTIPSLNRASAKLRRHSLMHVQEICLLDQKLARAAAAVLISPINSGKSGKAPQCGHGQRRD